MHIWRRRGRLLQRCTHRGANSMLSRGGGLKQNTGESPLSSQTSSLRKPSVNSAFCEFIQKYFNWYSVPFDPSRCTWKDVLQFLERAQNAAIASQSGDKHFLTKRRRKAVQLLHLVEPGLDAIPDTFAPLHGGLAIIFHVSNDTYPR